jgi:riboflavin kinase/FMN adenylyltransferase
MMKVFYNADDAKGIIKNAVITTGSFDGVHIGHKIIIDRLNQLAKNINGESCLVTFHPHPRKVLYPEQKDLKLINSQEEKIELLSKTGLQNLVIIPFSVNFSKTTSHDFITDILIGKLNARVIIVGQNHHFGHNRSGDYSYLYELSEKLKFQVEDIPLKDIENETVSSTKIRRALSEGNIMRANAYLDHHYIVTGKLQKPDRIAGLPDRACYKMNIGEEEKLIPPQGIYATHVSLNGQALKSMTIITSADQLKRIIHTVLFDEYPEIEGKCGTLYFHKKIKGAEIIFDNKLVPDELKEAREDIEDLIY